VNMSESSVCGGDAALCQITLTTCIILILTTYAIASYGMSWITYGTG